MVKKITKRTLQAERTKKKIFETTIELIGRRGFNNITVQDINEHAGISVGAFYHYYKSKEDVFFELYRQADDYFRNEVYPLIFSEDLSTRTRILLFFRKYAEFNAGNGVEYVSQLFNTKNRFFISRKRYVLDLLLKIINEGQQRIEIRTDIEPEEMMEDLFIVSRGIVFDWCLHNGEYDLVKKIHEHLKRHLEVFEAK